MANGAEHSVVIIGLPESGKTTFLAALWHVITAREFETALRFGSLKNGDVSYLNSIAKRWRDAKVQDRTAMSGHRLVSMNLIDSTGLSIRVTFPDMPGEAYRRMWEERDCEPEVAEVLRARGVLLFIHADSVRAPAWVVDETSLSRSLGLDIPDDDEVTDWHPRLAPTQVQLVDLLQMLPSNVGARESRRLAVMLSAWDKVAAEQLTPMAFLSEKLPLLAQHLRSNPGTWDYRVYGLSAQGGDYDRATDGAPATGEAEALRNLDRASSRIQLITPTTSTRDLTEPLAWLMS